MKKLIKVVCNRIEEIATELEDVARSVKEENLAAAMQGTIRALDRLRSIQKNIALAQAAERGKERAEGEGRQLHAVTSS
jgi:hypothetical protein